MQNQRPTAADCASSFRLHSFIFVRSNPVGLTTLSALPAIDWIGYGGGWPLQTGRIMTTYNVATHIAYKCNVMWVLTDSEEFSSVLCNHYNLVQIDSPLNNLCGGNRCVYSCIVASRLDNYELCNRYTRHCRLCLRLP